MSFDELVQKYKNRLTDASDKKLVLEIILREIDQLTYFETGALISREDKIHILESLRKEAIQESVIHFAQDNSEFLHLLDAAIKALGGK